MSIENNETRMRNVIGFVLFIGVLIGGITAIVTLDWMTASETGVTQIEPTVKVRSFYCPEDQSWLSYDSGSQSWVSIDSSPSQFKVLCAADVTTGTWEHNGKPKIVARYLIDEAVYPEGVPDILDLSVAVRKPLRSQWVLASLDLLQQSPECNEPERIIAVQSIVIPTQVGPIKRRKSFAKFRKPGCTYVVEVWLACVDNLSEAELEKCRQLVAQQEGLWVADGAGTLNTCLSNCPM